MICIGMSMEKLKAYPMYDGIFTVFTDIDGFYKNAYDTVITMLVLTDDFIDKYIGWESIEEIISEVLKTRNTLNIVLLGENIKFDVPNVYVMRDKWDIPTQISNTLAKIHTRHKVTTSNKNQKLYKDFEINSNNADDLISYILANPNLSVSFMKELLKTYHSSTMEVWSLSNQIANQSLENTSLNDRLKNQSERINQLQARYNKLKYKHNDLVKRINFQYGVPYEEEGNTGYRPEILNYAKVLYIKEISYVKYTQTLLYYLQNIMNTLSTRHTRSLIIEKPGAFRLCNLYPNHIPHYNLTHKDLRNSDIVMVGYQKDIMLSILQNPARNGYLLIWDRTGTDNLYVSNENVKPLYTFSDLNDNEFYNIPLSNVLSYSTSTK